MTLRYAYLSLGGAKASCAAIKSTLGGLLSQFITTHLMYPFRSIPLIRIVEVELDIIWRGCLLTVNIVNLSHSKLVN